VVGVRDEDADNYHLYIANLPREEFLPEDLAPIYRCRWVVERLFRELKTEYEVDEFDTTKKHIVKILVYAALLSLLISRELLALVTECAGDDAVVPSGRWTATSGRTPSSSSTILVSSSAIHHHRCLTG
jgi:putative transposase